MKKQNRLRIQGIQREDALRAAAEIGGHPREWRYGYTLELDGHRLGILIYYPGYDLYLRWIYIVEKWRRRGLGTLLIERLAEKLQTGRRRRITVYIAEEDVEMQLFLRAVGFKACLPIMEQHFEDGGAAYRMVRRRRKECIDGTVNAWDADPRFG